MQRTPIVAVAMSCVCDEQVRMCSRTRGPACKTSLKAMDRGNKNSMCSAMQFLNHCCYIINEAVFAVQMCQCKPWLCNLIGQVTLSCRDTRRHHQTDEALQSRGGHVAVSTPLLAVQQSLCACTLLSVARCTLGLYCQCVG